MALKSSEGLNEKIKRGTVRVKRAGRSCPPSEEPSPFAFLWRLL